MDNDTRLDLAKSALKSGAYDRQTIEYIFPELKKESEDERIKENTIKIVRNAMCGIVMPLPLSIYEESIDWLKSLKGKYKGASEHIKIQFENQVEQKVDKCEGCNNVKGCITCVDGSEWAHIIEIPDKVEPKFREGDIITSLKNRKLKYLIKKVGVKNELGKLDYVVECVADNEFRGKTYNMSINKVDSWGILVEDSSVEDNKVEPKFKTGDYVVYLNDTYMLEDAGKHYILTAIKEKTSTPVVHIPYGYGVYTMSKWAVEYAKEGDVLTSDNGNIILVKESKNSPFGYRLSYHCAVLYDGTFEPREFHVDSTMFYPATKEQRDTLERAIANAGYKWNEKELKLEKI